MVVFQLSSSDVYDSNDNILTVLCDTELQSMRLITIVKTKTPTVMT